MSELFGRHDPAGSDGYIPGLWDAVEHAYQVDAITIEELENLEKVFNALVDYESRITWDTTCQNCRDTLDLAVGQTFRAEKAEEQVRKLEEEYAVLRRAWEGAWKMIEMWRDRHADEHDRATRAELTLERVRKALEDEPSTGTAEVKVRGESKLSRDFVAPCYHDVGSQMDRTLCACGDMHFYCEDCSERTDYCVLDNCQCGTKYNCPLHTVPYY